MPFHYIPKTCNLLLLCLGLSLLPQAVHSRSEAGATMSKKPPIVLQDVEISDEHMPVVVDPVPLSPEAAQTPKPIKKYDDDAQKRRFYYKRQPVIYPGNRNRY